MTELPLAGMATSSDVTQCAHLRGLVHLADHMSEPVVVRRRTGQLIYANTPATALVDSCVPRESGTAQGQHAVAELQDGDERCHECVLRPWHESGERDAARDGRSIPMADADDACPFSTVIAANCPVHGDAHVVMIGTHPVTASSDERLSAATAGASSACQAAAEPDCAIIGQSPAMQQLVRMTRLYAASESTVLIQGESGSGKELVARTIHALSSRRHQPFVVVECSSLPETLLESELFGHVRGAFTGAVADRKGLFEEAEGGTIFLDEISETVPTFQTKLLRVLQEGEIKPVGGNRTINVNVRVLSACNRPLTQLVESNVFRSDLYYRLAVLPLTVPPLRERREDIPELVRFFFAQSCKANKKANLSIPVETMEALIHHEWPGNVRELVNVVERAVVVATQSTLTIQDVFGAQPVMAAVSDLPSISRAARRVVEKQEILKALQETRGDKSRAARRLKISRANLYNKLKAYEIC